jgi:hypothetical protein
MLKDKLGLWQKRLWLVRSTHTPPPWLLRSITLGLGRLILA